MKAEPDSCPLAAITLLRSFALLSLLLAVSPAQLFAKTVVFEQAGFPVIDSQEVPRSALTRALDGMNPLFADLAALQKTETLADADLLVLPYGSAVPVEAWSVIESHFHAGGNLLIIGGLPMHVPVTQVDGKFQAGRPQDTYGRLLEFRHAYEVPVTKAAQFRWKDGYPLPAISRVRARRFFAVEGDLDGLGYMVDETGLRAAAPVIVADHPSGGRVVCLGFDPEPGYWESEAGVSLVRQAAGYARQARWTSRSRLCSRLCGRASRP